MINLETSVRGRLDEILDKDNNVRPEVAALREQLTHQRDHYKAIAFRAAEENQTFVKEIGSLREINADLLAALELAKVILDGVVHPATRHPNDGLSKIEAAIAKAKGE
jgi:hypothetical protein